MSQKNIDLDKNKIIKLFQEKKFYKISKISKTILKQYNNDINILKIILFSEYNLKNYYDAEQIAQKLINLNENSENFYIFGNVLKAQNKNLAAINAYTNAINLNKNFPEALNNLANTQKKIDKFDEAKKNYLSAIEIKQDNLEACFNLANLLRAERKYDEALYYYKKVSNINEDFADAYNNIGQIYAILGKIDDAKKYFKISIKKNKLFSEPYKYYVTSTKIDKDDDVFLNLQDVIKNNDLNDQQKIDFYYAISKSYFDLNKTPEAFDYLQKSKKISLSNTNYSFENEKKYFDKIKKYFSGINNSALQINDKYKTFPIFILGMPRSGSSLIEQIISNHSSVFGAGELTVLPNIMSGLKWNTKTDIERTFLELRDKYLSNISSMTKEKYITDKMPGNFLLIGFILNSIPEAKIVHTKRNPMAVCWSNYKSNFLNNVGMEYTSKQEYIAEYYVLYHQLMNFWKQKYNDNIIEIDYEDLVLDQETNIKLIFQKLNLEWNNRLLDFHKNERAVETNSFLQIRSKIYKNSSEQWKNYKEYLSPMTKILKNYNIKF